MIEKKFIDQKVKDYKVKDYVNSVLGKQGYSHCEITKTPLGMKVVIYTSKPGLVVGRGGENIKGMTDVLRDRFKMQSPQIEVKEVENPELDPNIMVGRIAFQMIRFGIARFKSIGYRTLQRIIESGARGAEITIAGKIPGKRAKKWKFYAGSLPKSGNVSETEVLKATQSVKLKPGVVGITVKILPNYVRMPDEIRIIEEKVGEEAREAQKEETAGETKVEEAVEIKAEEVKVEEPKKEAKAEEAAAEKKAARKPAKKAEKKAVKKEAAKKAQKKPAKKAKTGGKKDGDN